MLLGFSFQWCMVHPSYGCGQSMLNASSAFAIAIKDLAQPECAQFMYATGPITIGHNSGKPVRSLLSFCYIDRFFPDRALVFLYYAEIHHAGLQIFTSNSFPIWTNVSCRISACYAVQLFKVQKSNQKKLAILGPNTTEMES